MHPLDYVLMPAVHKYTILAILISNTPGRVYTIQCRLHSGITTVAAVCVAWTASVSYSHCLVSGHVLFHVPDNARSRVAVMLLFAL